RNRVEARAVLSQVILPALAVPQLQVIADTDQDHLVLQGGELHQPLRTKVPPAASHIDASVRAELGGPENTGPGPAGRPRAWPAPGRAWQPAAPARPECTATGTGPARA